MNRVLVVAGVLAIVAIAIGVVLLPRSQYTSTSDRLSVDNSAIHRDFSDAEISRTQEFHDSIRPWQFLRLVLSCLAPLALLIWAMRIGSVELAGPSQLRWWFAGFTWLFVVRAVSLPADFAIRRQLIKIGLTHQSNSAWLLDLSKSFLLSSVIFLAIVAFLTSWSHVITFRKILLLPILAAVLTYVFSYLIPVVVEPMFNSFSSLPDGPQRTSLLALAHDVGVPIGDILVIDASVRTPAMNAYVSGIGSSRRVVVYDNLINNAQPQEVEVIVAHELGHVANQDVAKGTLIMAVLAAVGSLVLMALLGTGRFMSVEAIAVSAFIAVASLIVSAPFNVFSRLVESRADEFAIVNTQSALGIGAFTLMQKRMAITNYSDLSPSPLSYVLFSTHPTASERISLAHDMAQFNTWPEPQSVKDVDVR
jgi:STE24 endopeptidase